MLRLILILDELVYLKFFLNNSRRSLIVPQDDVNVEDADVLEVVTFGTDEEVERVPPRLRVVVLVHDPLVVDLVYKVDEGGKISIYEF